MKTKKVRIWIERIHHLHRNHGLRPKYSVVMDSNHGPRNYMYVGYDKEQAEKTYQLAKDNLELLARSVVLKQDVFDITDRLN